MGKPESMLLYAGIDEAGYGPMLGPLCVSASVFLIEGWESGSAAPDLWERLSAAVTRSPKGAGQRIPLDDSKRLKLANSATRRHPLTHLERGVLAMLPQGKPMKESEFLAALSADFGEAPWYAPDSAEWPVAHVPESIAIDRNMLWSVLGESGIRPVDLRCTVRTEDAFNEGCQRYGSKAGLVASCVADLISAILKSPEAAMSTAVRVVCDRQSGRTDYRDLLNAAAPGRPIEVIAQNATGSAYRVVDPKKDIVIHFRVEAEQAHLPVALASMTAKYVRELAMARFNRYWCTRLPGIAPTAGYTTDARRWLAELGHAASVDERRSMIRLS